RLAIAIVSALLLLIIAVLGVQLAGSFQRVNEAEAAAAEERARSEALFATSTALASAPTLESRPQAVFTDPNQVGFQVFKTIPQIPLFEQFLVSSPEINYLDVVGKESPTRPREDVDDAFLYLQPNTILRMDLVDNTPSQERIEVQLFPNGEFFAETRDFANGGMR